MPRRPAAREDAITTAIQKRLRARGAWVYKSTGGPYGKRGVPDLLCCYHGWFLALEVKRPGGDDATPLQQTQLQGIRKAGGWALVVRSTAEVDQLLDQLDAQHPASQEATA